MITEPVANSLKLKGWSVVSTIMALTAPKVLTALVVSFPLEWLVDHILAASTIHAIFGADHVGYWRCVGLFAIRFATQVRIKLLGPAQIEVEGDL
jgi:purine-cytosine permease-like protein